MKRYKLKNGYLLPPPSCGVDERGHAVSNFAARIAADADFAAANRYYPIGSRPDADAAEEGVMSEVHWELRGGAWHGTRCAVPDDSSRA
jgi:hypothetical protein